MSSQLQVTGEAKIRDIQGPVVANSGVITALDGAASQYVRGDGTLADFPTSTGGGSSVSYYLNSSVSQGTIGGVAYRQLGKTPIAGAGTDIAISANGYIASYLTDANDPALLEVPAGNFNCEFYFSVNSNAHNPFVYAEVYKYDGTTFTLIGSSQSVPEYLTNGTTLSPYYFAIPVAQTVLAITDRIAIRIYVNVDGRTVTLHTENNHLCQVVTTFSKGLTSLNNLTRQVQFLATGTSGTDFNIVSSVATHTFNLPDASATNRGLITTGTQTIAGAKTFSSTTTFNTGGIFNNWGISLYDGAGSTALASTDLTGIFASKSGSLTDIIIRHYAPYYSKLRFSNDVADFTYTFPDLSGTLALLEAENKFTLVNSFDQSINYKTDAVLVGISGYISQAYAKSGSGSSSILSMKIADGNSVKNISLDFIGSPVSTPYSYLFPAFSGTMALLEGNQTFSGEKTFGTDITFNGYALMDIGVALAKTSGTPLYASTIGYANLQLVNSGSVNSLYLNDGDTLKYSKLSFNNAADYTYTFPAASGTLALTSDLGAYVTLATAQTISGAKTFSLDLLVNGLTVGRGGGAFSFNTTVGIGALLANTTGGPNTAFGNNALYTNTTGNNNTGVGQAALYYNLSGGLNSAFGQGALGNQTTGSGNTGIGYNAGASITTGSFNIHIGHSAGGSGNTTGSFNTIIGSQITGLSTTLANNIILADGQGNIRYQWNGTNNVFGNPISGTSATFSSSVTSNANEGFIIAPSSGASYMNYKIGATSYSLIGIAGASNDIITGSATGDLNIRATNSQKILFSNNNGASASLTIASSGAATFSSSVQTTDLRYSGSGYITWNTNGSGSENLIFRQDATERMRITSTGNVGIGTSSPDNYYSTKLVVAVGDENGITIAGTGDNFLMFADGQTGLDRYRGFIHYSHDSNFLAFGSDATERMRITSGGDILFGTTTSFNSSKFTFNGGAGRGVGITNSNTGAHTLQVNNSSGSYSDLGGGMLYINQDGNATETGFRAIAVYTNSGARFAVRGDGTIYSTNTSVQSISDIRFKENIRSLDSSIDKIMQIEPKIFDWKKGKGTGEKNVAGFIAQEIEKILPEIVSEFKDNIQDSTLYKSVGYSSLIPYLVKAIQELNQKGQEQQAQIEELKQLIKNK